MTEACPRCAEVLATDARALARDADVERELRRWLARNPTGDADSFRAGWLRLAALVRPTVRAWETRWWHAIRQNHGLRAHIGALLLHIARLEHDGPPSPAHTPAHLTGKPRFGG